MLDIRHLSIDIAQQRRLDDISFQIKPHDYLCILGANGAGKSTLLKALMGIIPKSAGDILIANTPLEQLSQKQLARQLSYVAQSHNRHLDFTVTEFIKMGRYPHHGLFAHWSHEDQAAFDNAITLTHTEPFLARRIPTLSGGEGQRVMIATALCQQAPFLLLDEPSSFLDPRHQVEVHHLIQNLNQQHQVGIIEVTHDINHAVQHSEHILALKAGKTLWTGPSADFLTSSTLSELYDQPFVMTAHPETGHQIALPSEQRLRQ